MHHTIFTMKILFQNIVCSLFTLVLLGSCSALRNRTASTVDPTIQTTIDLVNVVDDKIAIQLDPGPFTADTVVFYLPKIIPGTYEYSDFGRFVSDFQALDTQGNALPVERVDDNTWHIAKGQQLDKITYRADDTFDGPDGNKIYPMGGTKIEKDSVFLLNLHGMVGYFKGMKETPYRLTIQSPGHLKPFSSMAQVSASDTEDVFLAKRYFNIIDDPILYTNDNAISFSIDAIEVNFAVYSPSGTHKAADFKTTLETMMAAQKRFLGDANNTPRYDILLVLTNMDELQYFGGMLGALEHHTSTTVVFFDGSTTEELAQSLTDVVSHEFFHTLTPLNVHSEQIHYFNYNEGIMSQHLWMYEGTTEYFANLFQIQQGLIDEMDFYNRINQKIDNAKRYNDALSFTEMSSGIVDPPYADNYGNVYEKGALINMCLDLIIREQSGGTRGILSVMQTLAQRYGVDKPFEDTALFDEIVTMTYPDVEAFINRHLIGDTPIDYNVFFEKVGLTFTTIDKPLPGILFVNGQQPFFEVQPTANGSLSFVVSGLNSSLAAIGFQAGDVLQTFDGTPIPDIKPENGQKINALFSASFSWAPEKAVSFEVLRGGEPLTLTGRVGTPTVKGEGLAPDPNATPAQQALRTAWLKN